jgi:DNA-binding Xre family transcriptional regulator
MRLRVSDLLSARGWTAYELSKRSKGRISMSAAYRLAGDEWKCLSADVLEGLCDVLELDDPGELFEREKRRGRR